MIYYFFFIYIFFFLRREGQAANESVNWSLLCIPPSSIFATLNFVFVVTQLMRISEDISKFWFVHHRQNMNAPLFFFFLLYFFFFFFLLYLFHFITRQIWRCGQPKADFTSANTRFRLVQHHQQTFFYYLSYRRKHFCTFQKTNWNLYFFYLPEKTFLRFPVKIHQKSNLRIRAN